MTALSRYLTTAAKANCPPDQIRNFRQGEYCAQPKQLRFHAAARLADADGGPTQIGYGGARGGAKSHGLFAQLTLDDCQRAPGIKALYLRKTGTRAREQFEDLRGKVLHSTAHDYKAHLGIVKFPNGSHLSIGHFKNESDIDNYLGFGYETIAIEEATTLTAMKYQALRDSNRTSRDDFRPRIYTSTNPGGVGHCIPHGDVLTPAGWIAIEKLEIGDPVYTVAPDGEMIESRVGQVHKQFYNGLMVYVNVRGLTMACTPEHRVAKVGGTRGDGAGCKFSLVAFSDLPGQSTILRTVKWNGKPLGKFKPPKCSMQRNVSNEQPKEISGEQYVELMGWFLSEGCTIARDRAFSISQQKEPQRTRIKELLAECGFNAHWSDSAVTVYAPSWWLYFSQFGLSRDVFVPRCIKNTTQKYLHLFFNAAMGGDGRWITNGSGHYYTISRQLADDMAEIALKLGYIVSIYTRQRENRDGVSYCILFKTVKSGGTELLTGNHIYDVDTLTKRESRIKYEYYSGPIYCIGIPETHSFIIRQSGAVWVSGNSWYKRRYIDPWQDGIEADTRFVFATVKDNVFLDDDYKRKLEENTGWRLRAYRYGDWDIAAGQFFTTWRRDVHVIEPFHAPLDWTWWAAMDYGFVHPTVVHLFARDGDGMTYVVDEHYQARWLAKRHAEAIKAMFDRNDVHYGRLERFVVGADVFARLDNSQTSIAQQYEQHGLKLEPANMDRINGAAQMLDLLGDVGAGQAPRVKVFSRCARLIECVPVMEHDPHRPEDVMKIDIDEEGLGGDDAYDCARYGLMELDSLVKHRARVY